VTIPNAAQRKFPPRPEAVAAVRAFVREAIVDVVVDQDAVVLMADELAVNAVRHARTPFTVSVIAETFVVRVEVTDGAPQLPVLIEPGPFELRGRGMLIVDRYATDWGTKSYPDDGKAVWFESRQLTE